MYDFYIYGNGNHSSVVCSTLDQLNASYNIIDHEHLYLCDKKIPFIVCIGDNYIRRKIVFYLIDNKLNVNSEPIIHPFSFISKKSFIGYGTFIAPGVVINNNVVIGSNCIINTNSSIDHHCKILNFVHIAPGSTLCGNVCIGENTSIYVGSSISPKIIIGNDCIISGGSFVKKNINDFSYYSNGKSIKRNG